ncbi:MAG: hypothetical protein LBU40_06140, partial [Methanobrevibacter sp.]|nr:hypothetical protein [Methanobrevibacter sp.]
MSVVAKKLINKYNYLYSAHETTIMYDNPNKEFSFYSKEIDGRLRIRNSVLKKSKYFNLPMKEVDEKCLITWKRRLPQDDRSNALRQEEEIEFDTDGKKLKN